ncbi:DUF2878 domain-containing protein [Roseateles sp. DC23W]|uniref:DUF2878 domain-containing protein n=1 Tax=Pelomonas dachongensis TaxID=3299029 RepID=A0ABW7EJR3_9BURK
MPLLSPSSKAGQLLLGLAWFALFQAAWFACVLGAAHGHSRWGVLAVAAVVALTWAASNARSDELRLTALALLLGLVWDTAMLQLGLLVYASPGPLPALAPPWILALWALFATLLSGPLAWLQGRPLLAALMGAVGGPLSYLAAVRLGAGSFPHDSRALLVLAIGWGLMTPALTEATRHLAQRRRAACNTA